MARRTLGLVVAFSLVALVGLLLPSRALCQERMEETGTVERSAAVAADSTSNGAVEGKAGVESAREPYLVGARLEPVRGVERALKGFTDFALPAVVTLAGIGLLVMAVIQLLKDLAPTREIFQRVVFSRYLADAYQEMKLPVPSRAARRAEIEDLANLATAGSVGALFSLPVEKFAGQLNVAMQTVMENPKRHAGWIRIMALHCDPADVEKVVLAGRTLERDVEERGEGQFFADDSDVVDARARIANEIQRSLDRIQLLLSHKWQRFLKWVSFVLGFCVIFFGVHHFVPGAFRGVQGGLIWFLIAAVGGFLAPVARDLMAALQSVRRLGRE